MGEVISFPEPKDPHVSGPAICLCCKNEWIAVAPLGTYQLECTKCGTDKGVFKYPVEPLADRVWECNCGSQLFFISPEFAQCYQCGEIQEF